MIGGGGNTQGLEYRAYMHEKQALLREIQRLRNLAVRSQEDMNRELENRIGVTTRLCFLYLRTHLVRTLGVAFRKWYRNTMETGIKSRSRALSDVPTAQPSQSSGILGGMMRMFSSKQKVEPTKERRKSRRSSNAAKRRASIDRLSAPTAARKASLAQRDEEKMKGDNKKDFGQLGWKSNKVGTRNKDTTSQLLGTSQIYGANDLPKTPGDKANHSSDILMSIFASATKQGSTSQSTNSSSKVLLDESTGDIHVTLDEFMQDASPEDVEMLEALKRHMGSERDSSSSDRGRGSSSAGRRSLSAGVGGRAHGYQREQRTPPSRQHSNKRTQQPPRSRSADATSRRESIGFRRAIAQAQAPIRAHRSPQSHLSPTASHRRREVYQAEAIYHMMNRRSIAMPFANSRSVTGRVVQSKVRRQREISPSSSLLAPTACNYMARRRRLDRLGGGGGKVPFQPTTTTSSSGSRASSRGPVTPHGHAKKRHIRAHQSQLISGELSPRGPPPSPLRAFAYRGPSFHFN